MRGAVPRRMRPALYWPSPLAPKPDAHPHLWVRLLWPAPSPMASQHRHAQAAPQQQLQLLPHRVAACVTRWAAMLLGY